MRETESDWKEEREWTSEQEAKGERKEGMPHVIKNHLTNGRRSLCLAVIVKKIRH